MGRRISNFRNKKILPGNAYKIHTNACGDNLVDFKTPEGLPPAWKVTVHKYLKRRTSCQGCPYDCNTECPYENKIN